MLPRCPIRNTLPLTRSSPIPRLRLYLAYATSTIFCESTPSGVSITVKLSLFHLSSLHNVSSPHALTAFLVAHPNLLCLATTFSIPSSRINLRLSLIPYNICSSGVYGTFPLGFVLNMSAKS